MIDRMLIGRRRLALLVVILLLAAGGAALLFAGEVAPQPVSSAVLGDRWQCHSFAFLTTCTRSNAIEPVSQRVKGGAIVPKV